MSFRHNHTLPPRLLDGGKVLLFARLHAGAQRTGRTVHKISGAAAPRLEGLVIIEEATGGPYYLLYCDQDWKSLTDTWHETLKDAKGSGRVRV